MSVREYDHGLLNFIRHKIQSGSTFESIESGLLHAGLTRSNIVKAINYVRKEDDTSHRQAVADNDYLPPLNKKSASESLVHGKIGKLIQSELNHKGLFSGRIRRKDFVIGILFFFGLGVIITTVALTWIQFMYPSFYTKTLSLVANDQSGLWLLFIPFIYAPITIMILSLITRRLHNLGLPGIIAWMYLLAFVTPFGGGPQSYIFFGAHIMLMALFIVLITIKGHPSVNKHGPHPDSKGSIFGRVWGDN